MSEKASLDVPEPLHELAFGRDLYDTKHMLTTEQMCWSLIAGERMNVRSACNICVKMASSVAASTPASKRHPAMASTTSAGGAEE